jgi:hypothetical protein
MLIVGNKLNQIEEVSKRGHLISIEIVETEVSLGKKFEGFSKRQ